MKKKKSEFRKYDRESRLWISGYYVMYGYWYKFLQYAERDTIQTVDWSKYQGWGGAETVLNTPFRKWWLENWKDLFGVENPSDKSKFSMSSDRTKPVAVKVALRVYENKHRGNSLDIYDFLRTKYADSDMGSLNGYAFEAQSIKERNRTVKRYMTQAETILDNVCIGKFPTQQVSSVQTSPKLKSQ